MLYLLFEGTKRTFACYLVLSYFFLVRQNNKDILHTHFTHTYTHTLTHTIELTFVELVLREPVRNHCRR